MGPYQRTSKEVAGAIRFSGLGVRSVGPVGDFLEINDVLHIHIPPTGAAKTSDILEQSHQDIDTWYYHETLRNDRGETKNDDFWNTSLPDFIAHVKSSGTMRDT